MSSHSKTIIPLMKNINHLHAYHSYLEAPLISSNAYFLKQELTLVSNRVLNLRIYYAAKTKLNLTQLKTREYIAISAESVARST